MIFNNKDSFFTCFVCLFHLNCDYFKGVHIKRTLRKPGDFPIFVNRIVEVTVDILKHIFPNMAIADDPVRPTIPKKC